MRKIEIALAIFDDIITIPKGALCVDGFWVSVAASYSAYCSPRNDEGPYYFVELGFPNERLEPWDKFEEYCKDIENPMNTVYGYVPVGLVWELFQRHGGIDIEGSYAYKGIKGK